jgi:hypothetical protein
MNLILLASHFRHHAYEELKPLVDFMMVARKLDLDPARLATLAARLKVLSLVQLCARLCADWFGPVPALAPFVANGARIRVKAARSLLDEDLLLGPDAGPRFAVWSRCLLVNGVVGGAVRTSRGLLFPSRANLAMLFKRPFAAGMYPRYYAWRVTQAVTRSPKRLTWILRGGSGTRRAKVRRARTGS